MLSAIEKKPAAYASPLADFIDVLMSLFLLYFYCATIVCDDRTSFLDFKSAEADRQ